MILVTIWDGEQSLSKKLMSIRRNSRQVYSTMEQEMDTQRSTTDEKVPFLGGVPIRREEALRLLAPSLPLDMLRHGW
jgi:hypothetical protein